MNNTTTHETEMEAAERDARVRNAVVAAWIQRLRGSERGRGALEAVAALLWARDTWSLDCENQMAVTELVRAALRDPIARELVQQAGHREKHQRCSAKTRDLLGESTS